MGAVVPIDALLREQGVWKGRPATRPAPAQPTGHAALDAALPGGGWPEGALTELLLPCDGIGELGLLWPALARLSQAGGRIVLVAPPYLPYAPAWQTAGIDLQHLLVAGGAATSERDALWAAEQCLRSGSCAAVLCWPLRADDRALRRLQVAAQAGAALAFATRPMAAARNPSPAALRIALDAQPAQLRVLKCRGGLPPARPIALASGMQPASANDSGGA